MNRWRTVRIARWILFSLVAAASLACNAGSGDAPASGGQASAVVLGIASRANEHVSVAAKGAFVVVTWAARDSADATDIFSSVSTDGGTTFETPVRVNQLAGDARASGEQPPRVALVDREGAAPDIVVLWSARRASTTLLLTARSTDAGKSFDVAHVVPGTDAPGNRGWHALSADPTVGVQAVWLDHRRAAANAAGSSGHQHHGAAPAPAAATDATDGVAMAQRSDVYAARLDGDNAPRAVTAGVCYCCKTAVVTRPGGIVSLAWRHVFTGNLRDIAFTTSSDGGRTFGEPVRVSEDRWAIAGCPDDGPSMAGDVEGRTHLVWPTMVDDAGATTKALFHSMTSDGRTFTPRVRISGAGHAHHPQIAVASDGTLVVTWDEPWGDGWRVRTARGVVRGRDTAFDLADPTESFAGRYPALAATADRVIAAWVSGTGRDTRIRVEPLASR